MSTVDGVVDVSPTRVGMDPESDLAFSYRILGIALSAAGRYREAITALDSATTLSAKNGWLRAC